MKSYDVAIIGAGIGGLVCGALLAKKGLHVVVFEKENHPGGYCCSFPSDGYVFDVCVDSIGSLRKDGILRRTMEELGVLDKVQLIALDPVRRNIFPDFSIDIPPDLELYKHRLKELSPAQSKGIDKVFTLMDDIYKRSVASVLEESVGFDLRCWTGKTFKDLLDSCIDDIRLQAVLSSYCNFSGLPASEISAIVAANTLMHYIEGGAFRIRGGMQRLINALVEAIRNYGGEVVLGETVREIVTSGTKAEGVITETGRKANADYVISDIDVNVLIASMVSPLALNKKKVDGIRKLEISGSFVIVYLGLDCDLSQYNTTSSIGYFSSLDIDAMLNKDKINSFGVSIPSLVDDSLAPPSCSSLIIYCPFRHNNGFISTDKDRIADNLIKRVKKIIPAISTHIVHKRVAGADTLCRYTGNYRGAAYGWRQKAGFLAHLPLLRNIMDNFYLVGHWAGYGGGIMPSVLSALKAVKVISKQGVVIR